MTAILITGGTSGIGRAIAERFARPGADVIVNYHSDSAAADEARQAIADRGARAHVVRADVGSADGVRDLVDSVRGIVEHLDVIVHCAASTYPGILVELEPAALSDSVAVNGLALVHLAREALDLLRPGSNIVYLTSQGGHDVIRGYGGLGVAKALGEHIVRYLAFELAGRGIRVNAVSPGMLDTRAVRAMFPGAYEKLAAAAAAGNPSGRGLEFDDVVGVVELLCRQEFAMVQGQILNVDGGTSLR